MVAPALDPDALFSPFDLTRDAALVVAVSGGSDSLAALLLVHERLRHAPTRVVAVTVDHGLRATSADEAAMVGRFCADRGIEHHIVIWHGDKPASGVAAAAREARYRLLGDVAAAAGATVIVTGHTANDQAETVRMRQARGQGRGLAGMAPATLFNGRTWIVRPLLGTNREDLRGFLTSQGVAWVDDPSNSDLRYERARQRASLSVDEVSAGSQAAGIAGGARRALGQRAARLIADGAARPMTGLVRLGESFLQARDAEAAVYGLRALLAITGGVAQLPDAGRTRALFERLRASRGRATLSRSVVDRRKSGVFLYREARDLPPSAPGLWDGRYLIAPGVSLPDATGRAVDVEAPDSIRKCVERSLPDAAHRGFCTPVLAPWRLFLPSFDLALAEAIAALLGAGKMPTPPFAGHNRGEA